MKLQLPFTAEQFFEVFRDYNTAVWPAQVLLHVLAIVALGAVFIVRSRSSQLIAAILAALWLWMALAYHLAFFATINPLAFGFGTLSLIAAAAFTWHGVVHQRLHFRWNRSLPTIAGGCIAAFSLVGYPILASLSHPYPELPTFGLPCPTTLFTLGLLGLLAPPYPRIPLLAPVAWCFVGSQAAFLLGVTADYALIVAGLFGLVLIARSRAGSQNSTPAT